MLGRLRRNEEDEIAVPVFDRDLEISRAGARVIPRSVRYLIVEGNYLLLDLPPWSSLRPMFDMTVEIDTPEDILRQRLVERWAGFGLSPAEIKAKVEENDLPNGRFVLGPQRAGGFCLGSGHGSRRIAASGRRPSGFLPTCQHIGVSAPALPVALRLPKGFGVAQEISGHKLSET